MSPARQGANITVANQSVRWLTYSRGLGAGIATLLAKRGANVVVNFVSESSKERAEKVAEEIKKIGTKSIVVQADLTKLENIPKVVDAALSISDNKKIDILIHK